MSTGRWPEDAAPSVYGAGGAVAYLCDNPDCEKHARIVWDAALAQRTKGAGLRFVDGFQASVRKEDLAHLDVREGLRLCRRCRTARAMNSP